MKRSRRAASSALTAGGFAPPKRPVQKFIQQGQSADVDNILTLDILFSAIQPCTLELSHYEYLMSSTADVRKFGKWALVKVHDNNLFDPTFTVNTGDFFNPPANVMAWGTWSTTGGTAGGGHPIHWVRDKSSAKRKFQLGDQLVLGQISNNATGPESWWSFQFFIKT